MEQGEDGDQAPQPPFLEPHKLGDRWKFTINDVVSDVNGLIVQGSIEPRRLRFHERPYPSVGQADAFARRCRCDPRARRGSQPLARTRAA